MTEAMGYWVREASVDGFRCDVAGAPVECWNTVRRELDAINPVFRLAEWESRDLHAQAFDATYAWSWGEVMHDVTTGDADVNALYVYYSWDESAYPVESMRMTFVSTHDQNPKHANTALWDGQLGAVMVEVPNSHETEVLSFVRENERDKVFGVLNLSADARTVVFGETLDHGDYTDYFGGNAVSLDASTRLRIDPWDYRVFVR